MKKKCIACLLTVLTLLLTGCGAVPADNAFAGWDTQLHTDVNTAENWHYTLTVREHTMNHYTEDGAWLVQAQYELPVMQVYHADDTPYDEMTEAAAPAVAVQQRVNGWFSDWLAARTANYAEICTLAEQDSMKSGGWAQDYHYTDTVEAAFWSNSHIACVTLRAESFTGGAHPIRSRTAVTFDMHTGEEITINDMADDYAGLRDAVALEILGQIENGRYVKYYNGELLFDDYRETIPEWMTRSVFFGSGSMTVVFGLYDIAAYAAGEQAFTIPYELIEPYLNDYGRTVLEME